MMQFSNLAGLLAPASKICHTTHQFENFTCAFGCFSCSGADQIACLRELMPEQLVNNEFTEVWAPLVDGVFLTAYPATSRRQEIRPRSSHRRCQHRRRHHVRRSDNDTALFQDVLTYSRLGMSSPTARTNDPYNEPVFEITNGTIFRVLGTAVAPLCRHWR
jgi:hypothetical protein